ncbi:MAG TPA: hypothetical protein VKX46_03730 [Ktedonobacteraceae bacterium]|nr:hypothetical protein [Ktedonobacteraceae bacterium]
MTTPRSERQQLDLRPFRLYVPVPPMLAEAIGYTGQVFGHRLDARWVGFYWERSGDEANFDDGRASGTGEYTGYQAFVDHPRVAVHLRHFDFGSSEMQPRHYLLLDHVENHLYALPVRLAQQFLHNQWQELGQASETEAAQQVESFGELAAALNIDTWQEVKLPDDINAQVMAVMERQGQLVDDLVRWLDGQRRPITEERIAEYEPHAPAMLLRHIVDNGAFAQAGEFVHIQEVHDSGDQVSVTFFRDNGIDGPDESHLFSISGSWATVVESIETLLETSPLDDLLESEAPLEQVFGRYAAWNGQALPIVPMLETLAIRVSLPCARCGRNPMIVYARSGCHRGAFCYVYDAEANFLADLRNQEYVCSRCREMRQ